MTRTTYSPNRPAGDNPDTPPSTTLHLSITADLRDQIAEVAARRRMKMTKLVRRLIEDGLDRERRA